MRRYQLKYQVVGGFSFYERAEIKDMISYLKLLNNPDDSIALLRVINTPARGIGKTTMETLERLSLETGISLWTAIGEVIDRDLLPLRAVTALKSFRELIEDSRAMLTGSFVERVSETSQPPLGELQAEEPQDPSADAEQEQQDISFDFGADTTADEKPQPAQEGFRSPGGPASIPEVLKFL